MKRDMTPEDALRYAMGALNQEQFERATAYATIGLLSFAVGAAEGLVKYGIGEFGDVMLGVEEP